MAVRITGLCFPYPEEKVLNLLNGLFQIHHAGFSLTLLETIQFPDLLTSKPANTVDIWSEEHASLIFLHPDLMKEDLFRNLPESDQFFYFQIDELTGVHRFCRQGDRNRVIDLSILEIGPEKKLMGENFLDVQSHEDVFTEIFPRGLFPMLHKNFHELPEDTAAKRYVLELTPPPPPTNTPPSEEPQSQELESKPKPPKHSIPIQKTSLVNNVSLNLRMTIVRNYFNELDIHLNPEVPESEYPVIPLWQRWNITQLEQQEFKWRMLMLTGTELEHRKISENSWFFDPEWDHGYSAEYMIGRLNALAGNQALLHDAQYQESSASLMYYAGDQIEQWKGRLNTTQDYFSLLRCFGKSLNEISVNKKYYFLKDARNGLVLYLNAKQETLVREQFALGKSLTLLESISDE